MPLTEPIDKAYRIRNLDGDRQLVLEDSFFWLNNTAAGPITVTVPDYETVPFPFGTQITFMQVGADAITLAPGGNAVLFSFSGNLTTAGQFAVITIVRYLPTNVGPGRQRWVVVGGVTP